MMSEDTNDFWQSHSLKYLEMAFRTDRCEILAAPDGYGKKTGDCGDTIEIFLKTRGETIETVSFHTNGLHEYDCLRQYGCLSSLPREKRLARHGKLPLKPLPNTLKRFLKITFIVRNWLSGRCIWHFPITTSFNAPPGKNHIKPAQKIDLFSYPFILVLDFNHNNRYQSIRGFDNRGRCLLPRLSKTDFF